MCNFLPSVPTDLRPLHAQSGKQQRGERRADVLAPLDLPHLLLLLLRNHQHQSPITQMRKLVNYEVTCIGENPFLTVFYYREQLANFLEFLYWRKVYITFFLCVQVVIIFHHVVQLCVIIRLWCVSVKGCTWKITQQMAHVAVPEIKHPLCILIVLTAVKVL